VPLRFNDNNLYNKKTEGKNKNKKTAELKTIVILPRGASSNRNADLVN
jgi:hypothetical protein